ncbi:MAG TPA: TonB family protein [Candidatus Dormibacteraeota bacterium]|nr:TonB family protein [Candidatus Dormibacteraeota bacterium]
MTAATVPPPSWIPIGAPEIRANTRRFFTRALAISGVGHLAVLGVVLWLQARVAETQPNWYKTAIHVIPVPPIDLPAPPVMPPTDRPTTHTNDHGTIKTVPWDPPTLDDPRRNVKAIGNDTTREPTSPAPPSSNETTIDNTPEEGAFVAFDQPPVPIYRPAPDYPGWAREQGIQGRVVLHVLVGRDGQVTRITVLRDVSGLTDAAREAIARWRFHPALSGRNPVAVWVEIPIEFKL